MELLEQIEAYLAQTRTSPSTFGRFAVGDPRLVADLRSGRRPRRRTEERLRSYLNDVEVGAASRRAASRDQESMIRCDATKLERGSMT